MIGEKGKPLLLLLSELNLNKVVRISTKTGTGFIYIGKVRDLDMATLEKDIKLWHMRRVIRADESDKTKPGNQSTLIRRILKYFDRKPLQDRVVLDASPGDFEPDQLRIRVEGCEGWLDYNPEIPPIEQLHPEGAINLAEAIYEEAVDGLITAIRVAARDQRKTRRVKAKEEAESIKDFFIRDPLGYCTDSDAVIAQCEQIAMEYLRGGNNDI